jgi:NADH dehydrogenase [ubiquinone] 1 alpha subcomplex assembly factor 7
VASALVGRLRERIRRDGPVPFRDWMAAALYDPQDGFYAARGQHPAGVGQGTHFATSPTLHPFFAHAVARELADGWKSAGSPPDWEVVEFGAGTGALARDAMQELRRLQVPARWTAVDVREGPAIKGGRWLTEAPAAFDAAVANEFLDALPFDLAESDGEAWHALGVGLDGDAFAWRRLGVVADAPWPSAPAGERRARIPGQRPWVDSLEAAGARSAVVVDYGALGPAKEARAFHGHDFADPLEEPGTVDLTCDVDFQDLGEQAAGLGFTARVETQERFLLRHGVLDAINRIDRSTLQGNSDYLRLRQLLLPTGFGTAFKVAVLSR